jgi:hypothetical protein
MQFLKAHYEKFILSVVLLGLAAAAALMPVKVSQERQREEERRSILLPKEVKPLTPIDLTTNQQTLVRVSQPKRLVLAGEHNIFNPVRWQKRPDNSIYRQNDAGPQALQIVDIRPLRLRLEFDQVTGTPQDPRYRIIYLNESQRSGRPQPRDAVPKEKYNTFTIEKVLGEDKLNPEGLEVQLPGDKQAVRISKQQPFERVIGFTADLRHAPGGVEDKVWKEVRAKDELNFGGETYNIVAITANEVVLSAKSNKKQTVLEFKGTAK